MDTCFVTSDDSVIEDVSFATVTIQMFLADGNARLFMHLCELCWDPSCTDFTKPKFVVHYFVDRTKANLQNMCHFINTHSSVEQNHVTCTLNSIFSD